MTTEKLDYYTILSSFRIQPTPIRLLLLRIINEDLPKEFTFHNLFAAVEAEHATISLSSIITTIGLFKIRGLIKQVKIDTPDNTFMRSAGRPATKLICTLKLKGDQ